MVFRCNGTRKCSVTASNVHFDGDPCPGTKKYLEIEYQCLREGDVPPVVGKTPLLMLAHPKHVIWNVFFVFFFGMLISKLIFYVHVHVYHENTQGMFYCCFLLNCMNMNKSKECYLKYHNHRPLVISFFLSVIFYIFFLLLSV